MSAAESKQNKTREALATLKIPRRDEPRRPSLLWRLFKWVVVLTILGGLGYAGYQYAEQKGMLAELIPEAIRTRPEVRIVRAVVEQGRSADALVVATGYLESRRQAKIGARAAGRIEKINVEEGTVVEAREVMAVLEHKDIDAALAASKAILQRAKSEQDEQAVEIARTKADFDRMTKLRKKSGTTEADYDQARFAHQAAVARNASLTAAVGLAEARVNEAQQVKENMIIRAPFDGTVISKNAEVGESILPGGMGEASGRGSVVTIADLKHLEVDCDVKEDYIGRVQQGAPAEVAVDAVPDFRYGARVRKIIPMGDRARATITVKVEILNPDERLFPDMSASVYFLPENTDDSTKADERRVFCDSAAVRSDDVGSFVWAVDQENRIIRLDVTAGEDRDGRTEIVEGLSGGEELIVDAPSEISVGTVVKTRK